MQPEATGVTHPPRGGTVLLAEDQDTLRGIMRELLEREGYRVIAARNGHESVELFLQHREDIDVGLFDISMPLMSGPEAAQRIMNIEPSLPFVFVTGFDRAADVHRTMAVGSFPVLQKPIDFPHLMRTVADSIKRD
jgi:two-component system, cell cycle sensor histidine kinase and response regulator CckA